MFGLGGAATKQPEAVQQTNAQQGVGFQPVNSSEISNERDAQRVPGEALKNLSTFTPTQSAGITEQSVVLNFEELDAKIQDTFKHLSAEEKKDIKGYNLSEGRTILMLSGKAASKTLFPGAFKKFISNLNPFANKAHTEVDELLKKSGVTNEKLGELKKSIQEDKTYIQVEMTHKDPESGKPLKKPSLVDMTMTQSPHSFKDNKKLLFRDDISSIIKETKTAIDSIVTDPAEKQIFDDFFAAYDKKDMKTLNEFFDKVEGHTYNLMRLDRKLNIISLDEMIENTADGVIDSQNKEPSTIFVLGNSNRTQFSNNKMSVDALLPMPDGKVKPGGMTLITNTKPKLIDMYLSTLVFSLYNQPKGKIPKEEIKPVSEAAIANVQSLSSTLQVQNYNQPQMGSAPEAVSATNTAAEAPKEEKKSGFFNLFGGGNKEAEKKS